MEQLQSMSSSLGIKKQKQKKSINFVFVDRGDENESVEDNPEKI